MATNTRGTRTAATGAAPEYTAPGMKPEAAYSIGRFGIDARLDALDLVCNGVIPGYGEAIDKTEEPDPVTQGLLIGQAGLLEQFHWVVRAHLDSADGATATAGARAGKTATKRAES